MVILKLGFVFFLILLNGFFVATEFAVVKVRSTRIRLLVREGSWRARIAQKVQGNLNTILSACQLGITLATIGLGWAGEVWVTEIVFEPLFRWAGADEVGDHLLHGLAFATSYVIISALHIIIGELAPKALAIQEAERTTLWVAAPIQAFYIFFYPVVWVLNAMANLTLRAVGITPVDEVEVGHTDEELRIILAHSRRSGLLSADEQRLMENVLNMTEKTVRQVMDPRASIVHLLTRNSIEDNLRIARESGHTRFPVCDGDLDHIRGMVHVKDLLWAREAGRLSHDFREIRRDVLYFPETVTLDRVLRDFRQQRVHFGIVVDEYGATVGMITLEKVLEELVGQIQDEFDRETPPIRETRPGEYFIDALCPLDLFRQVFGILSIDTGATTVGGLVFERCGHLPEQGETVDIGEDRFVVELVRGQRIVLLRFLTARPARFDEAPAEAEGEDVDA